MRRLVFRAAGSLPMLAVMFALVTPHLLAAQSDAQQLYQQAKTAYEAGQYDKAADLARRASQTDPNNAEVFLLLGRAHYQLGQIQQALDAWQRTLKLAPEEPYAKTMLAALQGQEQRIELQLELLRTMLDEQLAVLALEHCGRLLDDRAMLPAQRAELLLLQAEALIESGPKNATRALAKMTEAAKLYSHEVDGVRCAYLEGRAKLADPTTAHEGVALLEQVIKQARNSPIAERAQLALLLYRMEQAPSRPAIAALEAWLATHPTGRRAYRVRSAVYRALDQLAERTKPAGPQPSLTEMERLALRHFCDLLKLTPTAEQQAALLGQLQQKLNTRYESTRAWRAGTEAVDLVLAAEGLPGVLRDRLLDIKIHYLTEQAIETLRREAQAGKLAPVANLQPASLPEVLGAVLAVCQQRDHHGTLLRTWSQRYELARRLHELAASVPGGRQPGIKAPDAWAVQICLQMLCRPGPSQLPADRAVFGTVDLVMAVAQSYADSPDQSARNMAAEIAQQLVAAVPADNPVWRTAGAAATGSGKPSRKGAPARQFPVWIRVRLAYAEVLDKIAARQFEENHREGRGDQNAALSDTQGELLDLLKQLVAQQADTADRAIKMVQDHLQRWIAHRYWKVPREAYTRLADGAPKAFARRCQLQLADLLARQAIELHSELLAAGKAVPEVLAAEHQQALKLCGRLQGQLAKDPEQLAAARAVVEQVVEHYLRLGYFDLAEKAAEAQNDPPNPQAGQYAAYLLCRVQQTRAQHAFLLRQKKFVAEKPTALPEELSAVVDAHGNFLATTPAEPLLTAALEQLAALGRWLSDEGHPAIAAQMYQQMSEMARGIEQLRHAPKGKPSLLEQALFWCASSWAAAGRKELAENSQADPTYRPEQLAAPFERAVSTYVRLAVEHPASPLAGQAIGQVMNVAFQYAKHDAWDVADGIYARLLAEELQPAAPERLELCRALCQVGRVLPDHAREMLSTLAEQQTSGRAGADRLLASTLSGAGYVGPGDSTKADSSFGESSESAGKFVELLELDVLEAAPEAIAVEAPTAAARPTPEELGQGMAGQEAVAIQAGRPSDKPNYRATADARLLAMVRRQEAAMASQAARMRESRLQPAQGAPQQSAQPEAQQAFGVQQQQSVAAAMLSQAELARLDRIISAAYEALQAIRRKYASKPIADQARAEQLVLVAHWRSLGQWERAAELGRKFLADNPEDADLPRLRLEIARDLLTWASAPVSPRPTAQATLQVVSERFDRARAQLAEVAEQFATIKQVCEEAAWLAAESYLTQARVVQRFSPTLARGQFVRAARQLLQLASEQSKHPKVDQLTRRLWEIAEELERYGHYAEAVTVWNELAIYDPLNPSAIEARVRIAEAYHRQLGRPLKAAEAYQELCFLSAERQEQYAAAVFQIGAELKQQQRWVEALHVLEVFTQSYPRHAKAAEALTMVGQIHQTNEAWEDAIAAYRRVIDQFPQSAAVRDAQWAIAECTINLSRWHEAAELYRRFIQSHGEEKEKVAEARRRIDVLGSLERYQELVDEPGQRKAFDAQFQIARIVRDELNNPVKSIIEFRKVFDRWPESHLADDALFEAGNSYLSLNQIDKGRSVLLEMARRFPTSPLADDALFLVGKSYEQEADRLAAVTRGQSLQLARQLAQHEAYRQAQARRRGQVELHEKRIKSLKKAGKDVAAEAEEASLAAGNVLFGAVNVSVAAQQAEQQMQALTATQLADRQDKINSALRKAVEEYRRAAQVPGADKADEALLQMATIYAERLKDAEAAMATWLEIVRQFSGTAVAEDASWKIAETYEQQRKYKEAIDAYSAFLRNYRRSPKAGQAQFAIAENYERLGQWVEAMDAYTNYLNNFPDGPLAEKAKQQINWIKTYRL